MEDQLFYGQSLYVVLFTTGIVLIIAAIIGFRLGKSSGRWMKDRSQVIAIQASVLGLLALLLGFTFGIASSRYDNRRFLAVEEANALGGAFLRAQALPEPYRTNISQTLREYIDLRVQSGKFIDDVDKLVEKRATSEQLQQKLWKQTALVAREYPNPVTALFVESVNEYIDLFASRVTAFLVRVPGTILWTLALISIISLAIVGYGFGLNNQRSWVLITLLSFLVAGVIVVIVDLDRPESARSQIMRQSMVDLKNSLSGYE